MENSNEEIISKNRKYNQNLYKFYKMVSWDLLFYYAISFLFLTQEKGLTTSQIIFADAFYPLFKLLFQLPCTILIQKIGKKNSLILANLSVVTYVLIVLGLSSTLGYIISNIFCALGYTIKGIAESNLLYDSIESGEKKRKTFSKIDSFGSSLYYYFDAITAITSGFLFAINAYIPMVLCLVFAILSVILSYKFKDIPINNPSKIVNMDVEDENEDEDDEENSEDSSTATTKTPSFINQIKYYINDLRQAFKFIVKSNRLRSLIIFNAVFVSFISLMITFRRSVLSELNVPDTYFGIIFAIYGLIAGFSSNSASRIQKTHGNQTLTFLSLSYCISIIFAGLVACLPNLPDLIVYFLVLSLFTVHSVILGPYYTLIKQYLGSFSTSHMRTKILSATLLIESISRTIISFIVSFVTENLSSALSTLLISILFTLSIIWVLSYMKSRVGLKPEEYPESDINFTEIH